MPVILRIVLIISSVLMLIYMLKKVKKSKVQIEHTIFWIILGVFLILISLVPQIIYLFAYLLGIQSPVNLILAFIIFVLLIKQFLMTIEVSQLEIKIMTKNHKYISFNKMIYILVVRKFMEDF